MEDRILKLISKEDFLKIQNTTILLIGLGGVGGYIFECLIRSGFKNITVIDKDTFELSNLNRQILSNQKNCGSKKVDVAKNHAEEIIPSIQINTLFKELKEEEITEDFLKPYDYIIDACDTVSVKVKLIKTCSKMKKKMISSMGTANRLRSDLFEILPLYKTMGDPLAKKIRGMLKDNKDALKTKVVCSKEIPKKQKELGTLAHVPMASASLIVSNVLNDIFNS